MHSPFVYDLIHEVFKDRPSFFAHLESVRKELLKDETVLNIEDLGAGSKSGLGSERRVKDVARYSLSTPRQCRFIERLVRHLEIGYVLEFGSCLGLSAAYMSQAGAQVVSMEGSKALHALAIDSFGNLDNAPDYRLGEFEEILPGILSEIPSLDLAFLDGNHTEEATMRYLELLLPSVHDNTVFLLDDIHWSDGMESAWKRAKHLPQVTLSIDLFWCGLLFFRPGLSGEHFTVRY